VTAASAGLAQAMLRPMSAGDLLDQAIWIYRKHFRLFLVMTALLRVPIVFLTDLVQRRDADVPLAFSAGNVLGLAVDHFLVSNLLTASIALTIGNQLSDQPVSIARTYLLGARRFIPLLINDVTAMFGYAILLGVGFGCYTVMSGALLTVPGWFLPNMPGLEPIIGLATFGFSLVIGLIAVLPLLGLAARWSVTAQVIVLEGLGPLAAFHRSSILMHGQYRRVMLYLAGLFLLGVTLSTAPSFVSQLLGEAVSPSYAPDSSMRVPYLVLEFGVPALIDLVFVPVTFIARTVLYYELRVRTEGYDLARQMGYGRVLKNS
jgi:hypothetical protein